MCLLSKTTCNEIIFSCLLLARSAATKDDDVKNGELKTLRDVFLAQSMPLMTTLQDRLQAGKDIFLKYAKDAGATFNNADPDFDGDLTENEMFSALRLIIKYAAGIEIPATYNGLGYNRDCRLMFSI